MDEEEDGEERRRWWWCSWRELWRGECGKEE